MKITVVLVLKINIYFLFLVLLTSEIDPEGGSALDSRRAYQCMKFLVELASENSAVVEGLSRFPQLWGPAVEWLESLLEKSDKASSPPPSFGRSTPLGRHSDVLDTGAPVVTGRLRSGTFSGQSTNSRKYFIFIEDPIYFVL